MNDRALLAKLAALAVTVLLILTAWGNAEAMLLASVIGLGAGLIVFRRSMAQGGALAALVGFVLAIGIVLIMLLR